MIRLPKIKLAKRERFLLTGGIALLLLIIFFSLLSSGRKKMRTAKGVNKKLEKNLEEMYCLQNRYLILEERLKSFDERVATRPVNFTLFSHLESLTVQSGIKDRIDSLKPQETVISERYRKSLVKVKLKGITLSQLTKYLYSVESSPYSLEVRRLHVVPKQGLLDVTFEISTLLSQKD